jgi:hypothetical protein
MKHTKGPWAILDHFEPNRILIDSGVFPNSTPVAEVISAGDTKRANARLIAAAPDMLEALELANSYLLSISNHPDIHNATALHLKLQSLIREVSGE